MQLKPEPEFVNLLRSPRIDSRPGGQVRQPYLMYRPSTARVWKRLRSPAIDSKESIPAAYVAGRAGTSNGVVAPARQAGNRFLGSLKGLQIRALLVVWCGGGGGYKSTLHWLI